MQTKRTLLYIFCLFALFSACKKEEIIEQPAAKFTSSKTTVVVGEEIQFTNTSENATAFKWSFGDGTTSTEVAPKKSYQSSAIFLVSLVSTGEGGSTISTQQVTVLPATSFIVENESALISSIPVQFTNTSRGAVSYQWSFGDPNNSTSTEKDPTFSYNNGGTYTVTLKAVSAVGETTVTRQITVTGAPSVKQVYFIEYGTGLIKKLPLDGSSTATTVLDINGKAGVGLVYDAVHEKVYFSDFEVTGSGKIWRMNLDGSELIEIAANILDPYGLALDVTGGKIYWVDDEGNVSRANLDGSSPQIGIVNILGAQMRAISLDVENSKMYFYDVNAENLYVANLDGSNPTILVAGVYGYAILVDTVNDKIYFDDQNTDTLIRANLDGTGQITIDASGSRIYGMDIDHSANKLYWSGRDTGELTRANLDGTNPEILLTGLGSPRGMFVKQ